MKTFTEAFITKKNIASLRNNERQTSPRNKRTEDVDNYREAIYRVLGKMGEFEHILDEFGKVSFSFLPENDPDELPKRKDFVKEFEVYKDAFGYKEHRGGMGEEIVVIFVGDMEEIARRGCNNEVELNNIMFDELIRMADWYGIADEIEWEKL